MMGIEEAVEYLASHQGVVEFQVVDRIGTVRVAVTTNGNRLWSSMNWSVGAEQTSRPSLPLRCFSECVTQLRDLVAT